MTEDAPLQCDRHSGRRAQWRCDACRTLLCDKCLAPREARLRLCEPPPCPTCHQLLHSLDAHRREEQDTRPFTQRLGDIFRYPLHRWNAIGFTLVTLTMLLVGWVAAVHMFFFVFLGFAVGGFVAFGLDIIAESTTGNRAMPIVRIPDSWYEEFFRPLFGAATPWLPVLLLMAVGFHEASPHPAVVVVVVLATGFYAPMAMIATITWQAVEAVIPRLVAPAIRRTFRDYLILLGLWYAGLAVLVGSIVLFAHVAVDVRAHWYLTIPAAAVASYSFIVVCHLLGQFYHAQRYKLGWFQIGPPAEGAAHQARLDGRAHEDATGREFG